MCSGYPTNRGDSKSLALGLQLESPGVMDNSHSDIQSLCYLTPLLFFWLTSPLFKRQAAIPLIPLPPNSYQMPPPSSDPGTRADNKLMGRREGGTPCWVQLGFKKVKHFSSTKFQHGQQTGDSVLDHSTSTWSGGQSHHRTSCPFCTLTTC